MNIAIYSKKFFSTKHSRATVHFETYAAK